MNYRIKMHRMLPLLCVLCLVLTGCWSSDPLEEENAIDSLITSGGTDNTEEDTVAATSFALPIAADETLDPILCSDGIQQMLLPLLYEGLFELDQQFAVHNVLCSDYTSSADYTVWTFTLRSGVTFSDGSALDASDVVYSLQRAKTSERYGARLSAVSSIRAQDGQVVITLSTANNRFPALLDIPITSSASEGERIPAGTGPYRYAANDNGTASLVRNDTWWKGETLPVDTIPLRTVDEGTTLSYLFSSHEIQMLVTDYTGNESTSYKGNISVTDAPTTTMQYLGFNCRSGLFSNAALRRAFSLGIYRDSICQAYFSGHAQSAQFPVSPVSEWYPLELETTYSTEAFTQAMTEAGYNSGSSRTVDLLVCEGNSFRLSAANAVAASLSVCDVKVRVKALPYADYIAALQSGNFDLYYGEVRMTPDFNCSALLQTGGSLNYGGFSDPALDAQLTTAFSTASSPSGANTTMLETFQEQAPIAVICFKTQSVVVQGGVVDEITPTYNNPFYQLSNWQIHLKGETTHG